MQLLFFWYLKFMAPFFSSQSSIILLQELSQNKLLGLMFCIIDSVYCISWRLLCIYDNNLHKQAEKEFFKNKFKKIVLCLYSWGWSSIICYNFHLLGCLNILSSFINNLHNFFYYFFPPKVTYLFDNGGTVFFAIFMAIWGKLFLFNVNNVK